MRSHTRRSLVRALVATIALALVVTAFVSVRPLARDSRACPDFIQFWTAARLLSSGHSPYDASGQAAIQRDLGWRKDTDGLGRYDFLPYYYPPWLALFCAGLLPLGYAGARTAWLAINAAALLGAALLLRDLAAPRRTEGASAENGPSPLVTVISVALFAPAVIAVLMGQVSALVLLTVAGVWKLLERKHDFVAGLLLAWLTIKPQLALILIVALLAWCVRRGRWRVPIAFAAALGLLAVVSWIASPSWVTDMFAATSATELPTRAFPWTGATAFSLFRLMGLDGVALWVAFLLVMLATLAGVGRAALGEHTRLEDVFSTALIVPFFAVTYARHYDFPILMVPVLVLVFRMPRHRSAPFLAALLVLPYLQLALFPQLARLCRQPPFPGPQITYFWIPVLVGIAWLAQPRVVLDTKAHSKDLFRVC